MMKKSIVPIAFFLFTVVFFFRPFFLNNNLPIPSDTIVGLYHPFRDLYAKDYPNGIPYKNFLITDPVRQQYPWRSLAITQEKQGMLPLWNPYNFAGTPLLANFQTAAFYPFNFLFFLLPFSFAWSLFILLQPILGGIFLYLYLRHLKLSSLPALLGSICFAFSGFSIAWLEWGVIGHVVLWLPMLLLSLDKIVDKTKSKNYLLWCCLFLFSLIAAFFAGHLQLFSYVSLIAVAHFFAKWWLSGKRKKTLFTFLFLLFCFGLITALQWYPTLQFILQSARDVDQIPFQTAGWFVPWQHLIQFIAPDFFGNPTTLNYWGVWNYGELVGYVGIFPLILAFFALGYRRDKQTLFIGLLFVLSLIFALPTFLAFLPYQFHIPFLSTSQPTRLLVVTDFALAILAALGLDYFLRSQQKKKMLWPLAGIGLLFLLLWGYVLVGNKMVSLISPENISVAKRNLFFPTVVFAFTSLGIILAIFIKQKKAQFVILCLLLMLTALDLLRFADKFTPFTNKEYLFPSTKSITYLQQQPGQFRIMTTDSKILPPNFSIMYRLQSLDGYDPLYVRRYGELMAAMERNKPDISPPFGFNRIITPHNTKSRLIDLLGVRYVVSLSEISSPKFEKVFTEGQVTVYKNKQAFPRAFFVEKIHAVSDKQQAINALFDSKIDLLSTAIVEDWEGPTNFGKGVATITDYTDNEITVTTNTEKQAFLVLMDAYYPTWHAKVCFQGNSECQELKIYRTNYNFRGIIIPAGKHTVLFYNSLL